MLRSIMFVFLLMIPLVAKSEDKVTFDGKEYLIAFVDVKEVQIVNEFIIKGTTLEKWDSLVAARLYKVKEFKEILPGFIEQFKPFFAAKPDIFAKNKDKPEEEILIVLLLQDPDKTFYEYNLHRFVKTADGIKAYQFSLRFPFSEKPDLTDINKKQNKWIEELGALNLTIVDKKLQVK